MWSEAMKRWTRIMNRSNKNLTDAGDGRGANLPLLTAPARGMAEAQLDALKARLLQPLVASVSNTALVRELAWAANEAAALAWFTVCPVLFLPVLLEEKARAALQRWERQQQIQCARI